MDMRLERDQIRQSIGELLTFLKVNKEERDRARTRLSEALKKLNALKKSCPDIFDGKVKQLSLLEV